MNAFKQFITQRARRHAGLLVFCAIAALGAIAYYNSLRNSFHFDDIQGIVQNPMIRDVGKIPAYFTDRRMSILAGAKDYRPVILTTYALDYGMAGLNPLRFRLTNLLIHLTAAWLLFIVAAEIFRRRAIELPGGLSFPRTWAALLAAALFAVHTANSEAVDYIWSRSATLAALFYLLSFYCFLRGPLSGENAKTRLWHAAGLLCFMLGLGTKATIVTLPAALLLYETLILNPQGQEPLTLFLREPRRLKKYIPIATIFVGYVIFRFIFLRGLFTRMVAANRPEEIPVPTYLLTQFRAWIYYIRLFLWPHPLITDYPGFGLSHSLWDLRVLLSLGVIITILALAWRARRAEPILTFFAGWYFLAHLPESSFIPLADVVTGYRAYLANSALAVVATVLSLKAAAWIWSRSSHGKNEAVSRLWLSYGAVWLTILCLLIVTTIVRNRDWKDEMTLWSDVIEKDPTNSRAYANLGLLSVGRADYRKAQELLERAIAIDPKKSFPYMFRGHLSFFLGRNDEALADLSRAIQLSPRAHTPFYYRGEVYRKMGEYEKALADYQAALARLPFYTDAVLGTALVRMDMGEADKAMEACTKLTAIDPHDPRGHNCLGIVLLEGNNVPEAIRVYQRGVLRVPQDSGLWYGLGLAYERNEMYREAADAFERAGKLTQ